MQVTKNKLRHVWYNNNFTQLFDSSVFLLALFIIVGICFHKNIKLPSHAKERHLVSEHQDIIII